MSVNLGVPEETKSKITPRIIVLGVGGGGCNALNTMIASGLKGVEFVACNTDSQSLEFCKAPERIQLGIETTQGLGAGSDPTRGKAAAEESYNEICEYIDGAHMAFIAAGMGGGTGTGAISTIAKACKEKGLLTVAVVTKPFNYEGKKRMENAEKGIEELRNHVDTIIIIPNQNLFIVSEPKTTYAEAFCIVDQVLHAGVRAVTDLIIQPGLVNLDFADIRTIMSEMGRAVFGTGEASGERRAIEAAEAAITNPLLERVTIENAKGLLVNISGGPDMGLTEVEEAAERINQEINPDVTNSKFGNTIDKELDGIMRVSVIATGIENIVDIKAKTSKEKIENESFFKNVDNKIKPKFAEQTDLEDFMNPIVEIKKDFTSKIDANKIIDDLDEKNLQKKPSNIVLEFIKKFSPLKIFNRDNKKEEEVNNSLDNDHSMNFLEKENIPSNEDSMKKTDEEVIINEETIINHDEKDKKIVTNEEKEEKKLEITNNKEVKPNLEEKKVEIKPEEDKSSSEIKKNEKKTVQIQSEMSGLDEKIDEKNSKDEENLEIPSFLRNQSN
jgi:cell division protein FtsZ